MDILDGIKISDLDYDYVCLNCTYWMTNNYGRTVCAYHGVTDLLTIVKNLDIKKVEMMI